MEWMLQDFLFGRAVTRRELLGYRAKPQREHYRVQVFRNHAFEPVADTMPAYLDYAGLSVSFSYSDYDDSFSFLSLDPASDLVLLWVDTTRYQKTDIEDFFGQRLLQLKGKFHNPILLIPFGQELSLKQTGVEVWNLTPIEAELGSRYRDERAKDFTGTPLSGRALLCISKWLGLRVLPALLRPALKAVIVDLDNTLYAGVLGEDGAENLRLTPGHEKLQRQLKALAEQGVFLCAASKNDAADVQALFAKRADFPLKKTDFSWIAASWAPKADMMADILSRLNIGADSVLFVDDNIGELESVHAAYPQMRRILAKENALETCEALAWFPGLYRTRMSKEDALRKEDIWANQQRRELAAGLSAEDYIRSLQLRLTFALNNPAQIARISELANKTNQFIFNYQRYTPAQLEGMLRDGRYRIASVSLSDRLSDSGLIGVCIGKGCGSYVEIEECFISCRALGRGIDDAIVLGAIKGLAEAFGNSRVKVLFQTGPRNEPARRFVREKLSGYLEGPEEFDYSMPENLFEWEWVKG